MTLAICPFPKFKAFYPGTGNPLVGGQLYTLLPGTVGLGYLKPTYTDSSGGTANSNPVILDSNGEADVWLNGFYHLVLYDALNNLVWSEDNVSSMPSTVFSSSTTQWFTQSITLSYVSATQFSTPGDLTLTFPIGVAIQAIVGAGIIYGIVSNSSYGSGNTTVTVIWNYGQALDSGLSAIATGIITVLTNALPVLPTIAKTADYSILKTDHAQILEANKATAIAFTLPSISAVPSGWWVKIKNINIGVLTITGTLDGVVNPTLVQYDEVTVFSDGTSYLGIITGTSNPIGVILAYGGTSAPLGYLMCQGAAVSRTTYANLFAIIGTAYGVGDGSTTFNVPDLQQRFPIGKAASGTGSTLGGTGGAIDHTHTGPSHVHSVYPGAGATAGGVPFAAYQDTYAGGTGATGTNNPPFQAVNFIIKW